MNATHIVEVYILTLKLINITKIMYLCMSRLVYNLSDIRALLYLLFYDKQYSPATKTQFIITSY